MTLCIDNQRTIATYLIKLDNTIIWRCYAITSNKTLIYMFRVTNKSIVIVSTTTILRPTSLGTMIRDIKDELCLRHLF